jgi:hypothetical protein
MAQRSHKLITAFGPPSRFTRFCVSTLKKALSVSKGVFDDVGAVEVSQLQHAWSNAKNDVLFFYSDCPERPIVETYLKTKAPILLVVDDPADVTSDIICERGMAPDWAYRLTEQSQTILSCLIGSKQSLVIQKHHCPSLDSFLKSASDHFNLNLTDTDCANVAAQLGATAPEGLSQSIQVLCDDIFAKENPQTPSQYQEFPPHIESLFDHLGRMAAGNEIQHINWPIEMFLGAEGTKAQFRGRVNLLGPSRCIVYGPYLHVPVGQWSLNAELIVENCTAGTKVIFEIYQSQVIVSNIFALPVSGIMTLHATFDVIDPRIPYQLRLITAEGNIEGSLSLTSARLMRLDGSF